MTTTIGLLLLLIVLLVALLVFAFEVWMFINALKNPTLTNNERPLWLIGMLFIHPIVAIAYYFMVYKGRS